MEADMEETQLQWRKLNGERLRIPIAEEVSRILMQERAMGYDVKACIGTDSQVKGKVTTFATVIVFVRKGKGGFMYIRKEVTTQRMSIKQRMLEEVARSVEVAYGLCRLFSRHGVDMEVHADINTNPGFKSNDALKDAMGYIMGMFARPGETGGGFAFRAKPDAFASSSCANKIVQ
ncbi:MAG TPA: ribonuclease H-like YkuK family protein [Chitinophagaceae bacterium]|nr:ribonuclease H-like YkuK family protein [Chitinophagaceae bacterium]